METKNTNSCLDNTKKKIIFIEKNNIRNFKFRQLEEIIKPKNDNFHKKNDDLYKRVLDKAIKELKLNNQEKNAITNEKIPPKREINREEIKKYIINKQKNTFDILSKTKNAHPVNLNNKIKKIPDLLKHLQDKTPQVSQKIPKNPFIDNLFELSTRSTTPEKINSQN